MHKFLLTTALGCLTLAGGLVFAQKQDAPAQPQAAPQSSAPNPDDLRIVIPVINIVTPVVVYDKDGNYVNGLKPEQFHLFDNSKEQNIHVDVSFVPISMVVIIQANAAVEHMLPAVNKVGNLLGPLVLGEQGEAAVIAYDARIRTLQDFTSDPDKITAAVKKISPYGGSTSSRMVDAAEEATRMLKSRPQNRRRIILMIGETRDMGSEARGREVLINMQFANVQYYAVDMSRLMATLNSPTPDPRPDNSLPASHPMPGGVPATPTTMMQAGLTEGSRAEFMPVLIEIYRDAKGIFKRNAVEVFTLGTGGSEFSYYLHHGLEDAIERIGEQLHAEYTVSYSPNNKDEGGFHEISVYVSSQLARRVQARPGYWVASSAQ
jgi:VWFA-related protein